MKFSKYSLMSFASMVIPAVFPILVLSLSARYLGDGEFGAYLIIMTILGYSGLLELGMSRALVKQFSTEHQDSEASLITFSTGFFTMLVLGCLATLLLYGGVNLAPLFSIEFPQTVILGIKVSVFALPAILLAQVFYAYLEGALRYTTILKVKIGCSGLEALLLIGTLLLWGDLVPMMIAFVIGKYFSFGFLFLYCSGRSLIHIECFSADKVRYMLGFGGWLTLSSIIGPIMVYFDRFFVSGTLGLAMSEQYLAVSELAIKVAIIPTAIARVVFVLMARLSVDDNRESKLGYTTVLIGVVPILMGLIVFAEPILSLLFSGKATPLAVSAFQVLCVGLVFNAFAQIPFAKLLAAGYSKTTALIHLSELFPYLLLLYFAIERFGIIGVALVWSLRCLLDCVAMLIASRRMLIAR
ncbi:membrane protein [Vibrio ishigakensis]|uniref:Membrane protein n=1 Tax=Vibrio ishigakensis TaxID=1481914 RepID=A0A0B8Q5H5_9VIBR|nr:membrane protein [Vibrio ishigakensis]